MRILLTNDDGVYAPGLRALHNALAAEHEVFVCAPETEQSAVGHAITIADIIRVRTLGPPAGLTGYAVEGTPADCVKLAVSELMPARPDLVVSGINQGANVGVNLLYSGTVSAATEAGILGFNAVAFSLASHTDTDFAYAGQVAAQIVRHHAELGLTPEVSLNVNVPALPPDQIKGIRLTRQATARLGERFIRRTDPRDRVYYWQAGETMGDEGGDGADYPNLRDGWVTVTPIRHDLTHNPALARLEGLDRLPKLPRGQD